MNAHVASQTTKALLTKMLWGTSSVFGILILFFGLKTVFETRSASLLDAETTRMERAASKQAAAANSQPKTASNLPHGLDALRVLQAFVAEAATKHGCQLAEFKSATQVAPYTPRYKKNPPTDPWSQMDAHFTLNGHLRDVMETLRCLNDVPVPIEIDAVNFSRDSIGKDGSARLNAQVDLRALARGGAS